MFVCICLCMYTCWYVCLWLHRTDLPRALFVCVSVVAERIQKHITAMDSSSCVVCKRM